MVKSFKAVIKTRMGYERFELFLSESVEEVRLCVEETLKKGEKLLYIVEQW